MSTNCLVGYHRCNSKCEVGSLGSPSIYGSCLNRCNASLNICAQQNMKYGKQMYAKSQTIWRYKIC